MSNNITVYYTVMFTCNKYRYIHTFQSVRKPCKMTNISDSYSSLAFAAGHLVVCARRCTDVASATGSALEGVLRISRAVHQARVLWGVPAQEAGEPHL